MANYVKHSEIRLVEGCLSGSEKAWEKLYSRYVGLVRGIVRRRMRSSPEEQEDMTQAVFLELLTVHNPPLLSTASLDHSELFKQSVDVHHITVLGKFALLNTKDVYCIHRIFLP